MSHEYYYETVQREQQFLEEQLHDLRLEKERLDWEVQAITNDLARVINYIQQVERKLGK